MSDDKRGYTASFYEFGLLALYLFAALFFPLVMILGAFLNWRTRRKAALASLKLVALYLVIATALTAVLTVVHVPFWWTIGASHFLASIVAYSNHELFLKPEDLGEDFN